ncbi:MAG TPA: hypothetical protein PLC89_06720 [Haliscomenobacter sp.]|uniref:hypothetical protein n=1 Tax=Haliscomenobacter sp. TaxID=2717303 RepID=UPI002B7135A3|nr:hypothetical protein [Haliscomenobacter sp.]HOY16963.1 hypothetical protein [Haliscomenobacter sp.]HPH17159.1 hypothetical protein [Haliscomenobacter sp.]
MNNEVQEFEVLKKINELESTKRQFTQFYERWNEKCKDYKDERLSDFYDLFFSRFVTYNALYNVIVLNKEKMGILEKKKKNGQIVDRGDKEKAVNCMVNELSRGNSQLLKFFAETEIVFNIKKLEEMLDEKGFGVSFRGGEHSPKEDKKILDNLKSSNLKRRMEGVLTFLYQVRCNLFHGAKGYENQQVQVLKTLNVILEKIVEILFERFQRFIEAEIEMLKQKI